MNSFLDLPKYRMEYTEEWGGSVSYEGDLYGWDKQFVIRVEEGKYAGVVFFYYTMNISENSETEEPDIKINMKTKVVENPNLVDVKDIDFFKLAFAIFIDMRKRGEEQNDSAEV